MPDSAHPPHPATPVDAVAPPSESARQDAAERLAGLAVPAGALGRLGDLAVWLAATQGVTPPRPVDRVHLVVFAGDHGVADHGVSAYPKAVTPAMVRTIVSGRSGVSVLAAQHGVAVRVLDLGVDDDLADLEPATREAVRRHKVHRGSRPLHLEDALSADEVARALAIGAGVAREEVAAGAQLLLAGDLGIGNTTASAALVAAFLGLPAAEATGRGTGVDDAGLAHKTAVVQQALERTRGREEASDVLAALGSADIAAMAGFLAEGARLGVPVLLDGLITVAAALAADRLAPGAAAWFAAGHRSTEPAQSLALEKLGLEPLVDLGLRLGEGSGAVAAVPVLRSAALLLADVAPLSEVLG
ncbi:nicotinate-nucleotide--dimethylbenzimidazole phosphoribosyltransferase [Nocardioides ferulae]|uniref:nicotinate-nucleotide--dimethylbenzimidazole phosphoribosyltransferase n=1 Tax=Nocardioides ferulae TaxID=2340821 RepID=UPI001F0CB249|nr:nicotinate-nucleotide--dimethylbenzimidazole phosphoribosyltransferase [Nocardioides ferulae]